MQEHQHVEPKKYEETSAQHQLRWATMPELSGLESGGLLSPFLWEELGPHLTQRRLGRGLPLYQVDLDPASRLATINMDGKLGAVPLLGELGPHLTHCGLG